MDKLLFDSGIREFQVNDTGVLRFNPGDPNVFDRFLSAREQLEGIEARLVERGTAIADRKDQAAGEDSVRLMAEADKEVKAVLSRIFGPGNNFDEIMGGVNTMAIGSNGERVLTNFLAAITPILVDGAKRCANQKISEATAAANEARALRQNAGSGQ